MLPPREKGSNAHNPYDPLCVEYQPSLANGWYAECEVCAQAETRSRAHLALVREIGS